MRGMYDESGKATSYGGINSICLAESVGICLTDVSKLLTSSRAACARSLESCSEEGNSAEQGYENIDTMYDGSGEDCKIWTRYILYQGIESAVQLFAGSSDKTTDPVCILNTINYV